MKNQRKIVCLGSSDPGELAQRISELPEQFPRKKGDCLKLRIFHINDFHNHVLKPDSSGGWSSPLPDMASILDDARSRGEEVLFLSAGDEAVGTVWDYLMKDIHGTFHTHSSYRFLSLLGLDLCITGNHDLDSGGKLLRESVRQDADFPVLCSNLSGNPDLTEAVCKGAVMALGNWRIGFIGLMTMGQQKITPQSPYSVENPRQAAEIWLNLLKPVCDAVIMISHLGASTDSEFAEVVEYGDFELADVFGEWKPDLIISGHTHEQFQTVRNGVPIAQSGCNAKVMGELELTLSGESSRVDFMPFHSLRWDSGESLFYQKNITPFLERYLPLLEGGKFPFGRGCCNEDVSFSECKGKADCVLADFLSRALRMGLSSQGEPVDLVLLDGSNLNTSLSREQDISILDLYRLMPYEDTIKKISLKGSEILRMIEENFIRKRESGEEYSEKGFVYFGNNLSRKAKGSEAGEVLINGALLDEEKDYVAAISNYFRQLALPWEKRNNPEKLYIFPIGRAEETGLYFRDVVLQSLRSGRISAGSCGEEVG